MSVAWSRPGSRENCGHPPCSRYTFWSTAALSAAVVLEFGAGLAFPDHGTAVVTAAFAVAAAGIALALWPHPRGGDIEALVEATREMTPRPLTQWTEADWAEREKELSEL